MDWFVWLSPVPNGVVEFPVAAWVLTTMWLLALVPLVVIGRRMWSIDLSPQQAPELQVLNGGKEPRRHAA